MNAIATKHVQCPQCKCGSAIPDTIEYLFYSQGTGYELCRWCRRGQNAVTHSIVEPKKTASIALDLKIHKVEEPKEYQLTKNIRQLIKRYEYRANIQIYVSDGERIWTLSDFRRQPTCYIGWEEFCDKYPNNEDWGLIEFVSD